MSKMQRLTQKEANEYIYVILTIGEKMLKCGGEISRVEDSIERIGKAIGAQRVDVFCITSSISVTMYFEQLGPLTQTRRVKGQQFDLHQLDALNSLSRSICETMLPVDAVKQKLADIANGKKYGFGVQVLLFAMISACFSLFFGGTVMDSLVAAVIGIVLKLLDALVKRAEMNVFLAAFACSLIGGVLANLAVNLGIGNSANKISIGNIMLLISGIAFTNAIRDLFGGDTISGVQRFLEAVILAVTIAFGFAFAAAVMGGGLL